MHSTPSQKTEFGRAGKAAEKKIKMVLWSGAGKAANLEIFCLGGKLPKWGHVSGV